MDEVEIEGKLVEGRSDDEFMEWVYFKNIGHFKKTFVDSIKKQHIFQFTYWFSTQKQNVLLYKFSGYPIVNKTPGANNEIISWIGVSHNIFINGGAEVSLKSEMDLEALYKKFKAFYNMPIGERTSLIESDITSGESYTHFIEKKKHLISEEEKKSFLKCKETYNILFKLSLLGVMFSTLKGLILDANDTLLSIIGYTRAEMENGKIDWMLLTPPEYFEISARALQELKGKRWCQPIEKAYFHKSGKKVPVLITSAMIDGSTEQCITFVFDLSRYRQAEMVAIEAVKLKTQFITNISHELRTPCHGILGMTQLLLDGSNLNFVQKESIDTIKRSTDHLINLINDILDFSKLESGKLGMEINSFELLPMIEEVINSQNSITNSKGIDLILIMGRDYPVPPVIYSDRKHLKKILMNLVGNAVKFTEAGYVLLEVSTELESGDQISLKFTIKDTGIGIPDDKLEQIFIPFGQIDGSDTRKYGGSGLGLSYCKDLIDLMGGTIRVENGDQELGQKGTTFWFSIKVSIASPSYLPNSVPAANQFFYPEYKPGNDSKSVLIIESNQMLVMSIQSALLTVKCESVDAYQMASALEIFENAKKAGTPFDVIIISDQINYIKTLLSLVTNERVIIYGNDMNSSWEYHPQVFSYLLKPITYSKLLSCILKSKKMESPRSAMKLPISPNSSQQAYDLNHHHGFNNNNNNNTHHQHLHLQLQQQQYDRVLPMPSPRLLPLSPNSNSTYNSPVGGSMPTTPTSSSGGCGSSSNSSSTSNSLSTTPQNVSSNNLMMEKKKSILVVEDNDVNIKVIVRQLDKLGYNSVVGVDGLKALEIIAKNASLNDGNCGFCLILMDCQMPTMDGFICAKIIRELEDRGQRIPIIAMTANDAKDQCFECGMDDYLPKPVKMDNLHKTLKEWIKANETIHHYFSSTLADSVVYNNYVKEKTLKLNSPPLITPNRTSLKVTSPILSSSLSSSSTLLTSNTPTPLSGSSSTISTGTTSTTTTTPTTRDNINQDTSTSNENLVPTTSSTIISTTPSSPTVDHDIKNALLTNNAIVPDLK